MFAITVFEVGRPVTARAIQPEWDLESGETLKVETWEQGMIWDGVSVRHLTTSELQAKSAKDAEEEVKAEIAAIELQDIMNRRAREAFILQAEAIAADQYGLTPEQLYAVNPGYRGAKDVDNQIKALRAQL